MERHGLDNTVLNHGEKLNEQETLTSAAHRLVSWYRRAQRKLPWRETSDPYAIWISETMLQQTRVDTVIPYYHRFLTAFPNVSALASASEDKVIKLWQGLGYYSRVRNLHRAAQQVVEKYGGLIPQDADSLALLPGIGPYTQGALLSIAFGQPHPAVDGNVLRVMSRYLALEEPIQTKSVQNKVFNAVRDWMTEVPPAELSQALMELGATVCTPRTADCSGCPISAECHAYRLQMVESFPVRRPKAVRRQVDVVALWVDTKDGLLMQQRPSEGLLATLWQLPCVEIERESEAPLPEERQRERAGALYATILAADIANKYAAESPLEFALLMQERHIFSHIEWHVSVWRPIRVDGQPVIPYPVHSDSTACRYVQQSGLDRLALPRVYERIIQSILNKKG